MPNGRVHSAATLILAAVGGLAAWRYYGVGDVQAIALAGGTLTGLLLTPDLDVNGGSIAHQRVRQFNWGLGLIWTLIWTPYSYVIPHRSLLSHGPLIGTFIRVGYLAGIIMLFVSMFHQAGVIQFGGYPAWWPWAFAGLVLADTLHWIMDNTLRN